MDGKAVVVTGALGALGNVVWRGARAWRQDRERRPRGDAGPGDGGPFRVGGVDLSDAAQAKGDRCGGKHFGRLDALINVAGGFAFETVADGALRPGNGCMRST